jgi:hypothetical protein
MKFRAVNLGGRSCPWCHANGAHAPECTYGIMQETEMPVDTRDGLVTLPKDSGNVIGDNVHHPPHYNQGKIEVIEFIEDKELGFHLGNAVKYIARAGRKDPAKYVEDLEKAIWYIRRRIELKKENPRRPNDMKE